MTRRETTVFEILSNYTVLIRWWISSRLHPIGRYYTATLMLYVRRMHNFISFDPMEFFFFSYEIKIRAGDAFVRARKEQNNKRDEFLSFFFFLVFFVNFFHVREKVILLAYRSI